MALRLRVVHSVEESKPQRVPLLDHAGEPLGADVFLRVLPKDVKSKLAGPVQDRKTLLEKNDTAENRKRLEAALEKWQTDLLLAAFVDSEGVGVDILGEASASAYAPFFPGVKDGDYVVCDGKWTEDLKRRVFGDRPDFAALVLAAHLRLEAIDAGEQKEIEAGKEPA